MFHVEISRVRREFLLLTDDREALIELLEGRADSGDGALEALGIDPVSVSGAGPTAIPSEDAEAFRDPRPRLAGAPGAGRGDRHPPPSSFPATATRWRGRRGWPRRPI